MKAMKPLLLALLSLSACARDGNTDLLEIEPAPPGEVFDEGGAPPVVRKECTNETQQIYVVATDKSLYRFYPLSLTFVRVGTLNCPSNAGTFSMAIDRFGTAWIEYTDGRLFEVDTNDAKCKPTGFKHGQTGFETFGMGYARNGDDEKAGETLYVAGAGLAALDTVNFELKFLGSLSFGRTELTAKGSSLFAYSVGSGVIAGLDKTNAAVQSIYRTTAIDGRAGFAFAHWGGDFYVFVGRDFTTVTLYSPATDTSSVVVENTGMLIVGAGSSTCAPLERPK
jgi:hypothetical protein